MKQKINWMNHAIELGVVVVGITIAFILNSWREGSKETELKMQYVQSFYKDVAKDSLTLSDVLKVTKGKIERVKKLVLLRQSEIIHPDSAMLIAMDILAEVNFQQQRSTYENIKYSGNLNLIDDFELKENIITYYENFESINMKEDISFRYLYDYSLPFIYGNMDIKNTQFIAWEKHKNEFINVVMGYYVLIDQKYQTYKSLQEKNSHILLLLDRLVDN